MRRLLFALAVATAALVHDAAPARAQMADALGRPLPKSDLPTGTLTVRVVAGEMSKPVVGADVTLTVDGTPRIARTNESGRATFPDLPGGATVQASVPGPDDAVTSQEFEIPSNGGVAVLLSTEPFTAPAGMPPMMGGGGAAGRPPPRVASGKARPEAADPRGRVTVRLSYNNWDDTAGTADRPVVMVAYAADDRVGAKVVHSDAAGHAVFDGLDVSGSTAYYALTLLPRNGAEDRVVSDPILPAADAGMRVMLSGDKDAAPPVDDLGKVVPQPALPGGQVLAAFVGAPDADATAELYDLVAGKVIATHKLERSRAIPSTVTATMGELATTDDAPPGALRVVVRHAAGGNPVPLRDIAVLVRQGVAAPAGADAAPVAERPTVGTGVSDAAGLAKLEGLPTGVPLELTVVLEGKPITKAFTLDAAHGGTIDVTADWQVLGMYQAIFDGVAPTPEGAYLVQTTMHEQLYRSNPFQLTAGHGAAIPVYVLPRIAMTFELDGHVDDAYMAFQGSIVVQNFGWAPYAGPTEGVRVPVPRGATGLVLADQDKEWVSADADAFRLTRPVPPWGGSFRCAFSLPIDGGDVTWDLQLPYGSYESSLGILDNPGMKLDLPATQRVDMVPSMDGSRMFHALRSITIQPKQRMVFTIHGLPVAPTWPRIGRYVAGITALVLLALGLVFALDRARRAAAADDDDKDRAERKRRKRRIEELLDEVAALDRAGAGGAAASGASKGGKPGKGKGKGKGGDGPPRSRQALVAELERLYREDAAQEPARDGA